MQEFPISDIFFSYFSLKKIICEDKKSIFCCRRDDDESNQTA